MYRLSTDYTNLRYDPGKWKSNCEFDQNNAKNRCQYPDHSSFECVLSGFFDFVFRFLYRRLIGYQRIAIKARKIEAMMPSTTAIVPALAPGPIYACTGVASSIISKQV
jgi:hypothetical protein